MEASSRGSGQSSAFCGCVRLGFVNDPHYNPIPVTSTCAPKHSCSRFRCRFARSNLLLIRLSMRSPPEDAINLTNYLHVSNERSLYVNRRGFNGQTLSGGVWQGASTSPPPQSPLRELAQQSEVFIERDQPDRPHKGKVLAAIQPHCDDLSLFASGTILKLIRDGYTGILIRTSNDEMAGRGATMGEVVLNNERDNLEVGRRLGLGKVFDLHYRNHEFDSVAAAELRHRLIFIFRLMKVDTVICYDPWGHYEENPDHYITARCVEAACWMAGGRWDLPEHFEAGLQPHAVQEKYYFARGPQLVTRVVDIGSVI